MYQIQTGAFINEERCREFVFNLRRQGIKCRIEWKDNFWKSYIDNTYDTLEEAQTILSGLKEAYGNMFPLSYITGKE